MNKAVNDATLSKAGDIYQYLIALRDCFGLDSDDILQIEVCGDVSVIKKNGGSFQREVKHHIGDTYLTDRDVDFWKTLANWYCEYERIKLFSSLILYTTSRIKPDSLFSKWDSLDASGKIEKIKSIGSEINKREKEFRKQYNRIFNDSYNQDKLVFILERLTIEVAQTQINGISKEFSKIIGYIPEENRDGYISSLLGQLMFRVKDPPHKWELNRNEFEKIMQSIIPLYCEKDKTPLPDEYAKAEIPSESIAYIEQKKFVVNIREIEYDKMIPDAISDYWKADMTVANYFRNNIMYLKSLDSYMDELKSRMYYAKEGKELETDGVDEREKIKLSKKLYVDVMKWDADDFGSIVRNQGYFQRGVIHSIVDETDYDWKVGKK